MMTKIKTPYCLIRLSSYLFMTFSVIVCGCGRKSISLAPVKHIIFKQNVDMKMASLFDDFTFIQLESNDDCVIPGIKRVIDVNDTLVVLSNTDEVFTFERNTGKYIGRISEQGEGPEEYVEASEIIATSEHRIGVVDRMKGDIKFFNTKGQYIATRKIGGEVSWMNSAELTPDGKLLVSNQLTGGYPPQKSAYTLASIGGAGKPFTFDNFAPVTVGQYSTPFAEKPATVCGNDVSFLKFLNDTLFCYKNHSIAPVCRLVTPQPFPSKEVVAKQGEYDVTKMAALNRNGNFFMGFNSIYETQGLLLLMTNVIERNGYYWVDKRTQQGYVYPGNAEVDRIMRQIIEGHIVADPVGSSSKEMIGSIVTEEEMEAAKAIAAKGQAKPFTAKLPAFLNGVDPEGNPCLLIYSHRK